MMETDLKLQNSISSWIFHYDLVNGSMCNFDVNIPECIDKTLVKYPGARTRHQVSKLTYQAAYKLCESRNLDALAVQLQHSRPNLFEEYEMIFFNSTNQPL